ncbi:MAG: S8 family peptidase [Mycobacterium sp.]
MDESDGATDDGEEPRLDPRNLDRSIIALPLLHEISAVGTFDRAGPIAIVIDLNLEYRDGLSAAADRVLALIGEINPTSARETGIGDAPGDRKVSQFVVAQLRPDEIQQLVRADQAGDDSAIFHIWPDFPVNALLDKSVSTVKCDAARTAFNASGEGITWAVLDTGVDSQHLHFKCHGNLAGPVPHRDFTGEGPADQDENGHGTHVAGIIAGFASVASAGRNLSTVRFKRDETDQVVQSRVALPTISGVAPQCSIVSYKVLDKNGAGKSSSILNALQAVQEVNGYGRRLRIHGVNLSLGYGFKPEWFACGQSPLCIEVDRLVKSGVAVVVAAGNTGYALSTDVLQKKAIAAGRLLTINDPGNADLAITVGSTHRDMPHTYGVSYFSSKGPTGDGRTKPDLVAPGERILSAAAGEKMKEAQAGSRRRVDYVESSGTSMAAPHVSGVIAAFLSIRQEFIGQPEKVKRILCDTATDLGRTRDFQGRGLIDAMRAIQSV